MELLNHCVVSATLRTKDSNRYAVNLVFHPLVVDSLSSGLPWLKMAESGLGLGNCFPATSMMDHALLSCCVRQVGVNKLETAFDSNVVRPQRGCLHESGTVSSKF